MKCVLSHIFASMKRNVSVLLLSMLLASCQSTKQFGIDYMVPANVGFPPQLKRIAIVNNVNDTSGNLSLPVENTPTGTDESVKRTVHFDGIAGSVAESLAEHIAVANYFEEVLICDSALRTRDVLPRETALTQEEVKELTEDFGADAILALEDLWIESVNAVEFIPGQYMYCGTLDVTIRPKVNIYIPSRSTPVAIINAADSIFWKKYGKTRTSVVPVIPAEQMAKEIIDFAGGIPVKYLMPHWETANRYIYTGGSTEMRDAAVCAGNNQWEKACKLWEQAALSKRKRLQMYAALNMAVYNEMNDKIEDALMWAMKAKQLAREEEKIKDGTPINYVSHYYSIASYLSELQIREGNAGILNAQMERFKEEF
ncbi:hypothetical protein EZS27_006719 [termite gut metagenome]|uniref:Uncharacterized protein n=1 Tax=termite gut metagenome TaxID=433724 RepID=A0A5J4SK51_9ZZZZ